MEFNLLTIGTMVRIIAKEGNDRRTTTATTPIILILFLKCISCNLITDITNQFGIGCDVIITA